MWIKLPCYTIIKQKDNYDYQGIVKVIIKEKILEEINLSVHRMVYSCEKNNSQHLLNFSSMLGALF